ncbi:Hepatoma derived growth factor protein [Fasciola gigantica]|uniref:Hepatoma derived growth factor protein n=1 Tax=Fasciola gigantica TaxID=46835 RepID=A0A504YNI2_FASGI|nr:Hepatoma derived growth factor protein [Fasciola gigantica]
MAHRPGDRVFAKIKGFSNWPARINPLPPDVQIPKGKLPVFFYGTYQVSFVPPKNIVPYEKFKDKWGKPKSSPQFTTAMQEIESNPGIFMLGEDPRAESFLLQFYKFRPGHTLPSTKNKAQEPENDRPPSSPDDLSSLSDTTNAPMPTAPPSRSVPSKKDVNRTDFKSQHIQESVKSAPEIREHLSETSSDFSSALSKQDSADIIDDDVVSDDDAVTKQSQNQEVSTQPSDVEDESLSASVTHSTDHTEPLGGYELDSESREAYRLARKQKKAEKRAMKAAKREAKRLVKEQERAEKRARREAKRELKRLHRLKKQQIASSDYQEEEFSQDVMVMPSPSAMDWTMQAGIDSVAGGDLSPFDACIEAELQQGNLTPLSDRPTSPLRLEDYPAIECYEDLTMVQSVEELTDSVHESLPVPSPPTKIDQLPFSPSPTESEQQKSSPMRTAKRTLEETSPVHDVGKCDELDVPPKKRPKSDSWLSTLRSNSRPEKIKSRGSPDLDKSDDQSTVKSRPSHSRTKKLQSSRRRLLSDTSEDEHVEEANRIRSPVHEDVPKPSPTVPNDPSEQTEDKPKENDPTQSEQVEPKPVKSESSVEHHKKQYSHKNHKNQPSKGRNQRPSTHPRANSHKPNKHEPTKNADLRAPKKSHTPESTFMDFSFIFF